MGHKNCHLTTESRGTVGYVALNSMGKISTTLWWTNILQWKITIFNGKIHYKWPFSIAMLVHQRVTSLKCMVSKIGQKKWGWITRLPFQSVTCLEKSLMGSRRLGRPSSEADGILMATLVCLGFHLWKNHGIFLRFSHRSTFSTPRSAFTLW